MQSEYQTFGKWDLLGLLGEGGFGEVRHWKNRETGTEIATKSLKRNPNLRCDEIEILKRRWVQELIWMKTLNIPFIVGVKRLDDDDFLRYLMDRNPCEMLPVIVMEYCNGGDLRNLLAKDENVNGLSQYEILGILQTLRFAVEHLHNNCNIEHRDIKPENIVIHRQSNTVMYKLTDFGYAREIPENTIAQSVVGTRHYVAPEVIDPGYYTQTVDYWSVGVLTYEIICGIRPFIPHRDFRDILIKVIDKPTNCIAITERIGEPDANNFVFEEMLVQQNKCDPIFISKIEIWLRSALDKDYRTRGMQNGQLRFYADLDDILAIKILSVYSICSYKIYYYNINDFTNLDMFYQQLSVDTHIPQQYMYFTLPTSHPKRSFNNISTLQDFFVPEWSDTSNPDNPPVMLYVSNITQCDFNVDMNDMFQMVPESVSQCIKIGKKKYGSLPSWAVDQFERNLVFLLSEQQRLLKCHMNGLYEYVMAIEEDAFHYEPMINHLHQQVIMLSGRVKQFSFAVEQINKMSMKKELIKSSQNFQQECETLNKDVTPNIAERYKSVSRLCKDLSGRTVYKSLPADDIFNLNDFRLNCDRVRCMSTKNNSKLVNVLMTAFDKWAEKIVYHSNNLAIKKIHSDIHSYFSMFPKLKKTVEYSLAFVRYLESLLEKTTSRMFEQMLSSNNDQLVMKMATLSIDGSQQAAATTQSLVVTNGYGHPPNGDIIDLSSASQLMDEVNNTLNDIIAIMDDDTMSVDIPTTIQDI